MIEKIKEDKFEDNLQLYKEYDDRMNYEFIYREYKIQNYQQWQSFYSSITEQQIYSSSYVINILSYSVQITPSNEQSIKIYQGAYYQNLLNYLNQNKLSQLDFILLICDIIKGIQFCVENNLSRDINLLNIKVTQEQRYKLGEFFLLTTLLYTSNEIDSNKFVVDFNLQNTYYFEQALKYAHPEIINYIGYQNCQGFNKISQNQNMLYSFGLVLLDILIEQFPVSSGVYTQSQKDLSYLIDCIQNKFCVKLAKFIQNLLNGKLVDINNIFSKGPLSDLIKYQHYSKTKIIINENLNLNQDFLKNLYPIESIKIYKSFMMAEDFELLLTNLGPYLIELRIEYCNLTDNEVSLLLKHYKTSQIQVLSLRGNKALNGHFFCINSNKVSRLRELDIGFTSVDYQIFKNLNEFKDIRNLKMEGCKKITDKNISNLFAQSNLVQNLRKLTLGGLTHTITLTDITLSLLISQDNYRQLETLNLVNCCFSEKETIKFLEKSQKLEKLKKLSLDSCGYDEISFKNIMSSNLRLGYLEEIYFGTISVEDEVIVDNILKNSILLVCNPKLKVKVKFLTKITEYPISQHFLNEIPGQQKSLKEQYLNKIEQIKKFDMKDFETDFY